MPKVFRKLLFLTTLLAACSSGEIAPVPIEAGDMCSNCRMAISERQFASEIIEQSEKVHKFDDIGCLLKFKEKMGDTLDPAAIFVTGVSSREWVRAEKAFFVRSANFKTPMGSGIVAYSNASEAGAEALNFEQLTVR